MWMEREMVLERLLFGSGKVRQTYNYENNLASGEFVTYYETGKTESKMVFKNDKLDGHYSEYYPNGKLKATDNTRRAYFRANGNIIMAMAGSSEKAAM